MQKIASNQASFSLVLHDQHYPVSGFSIDQLAFNQHYSGQITLSCIPAHYANWCAKTFILWVEDEVIHGVVTELIADPFHDRLQLMFASPLAQLNNIRHRCLQADTLSEALRQLFFWNDWQEWCDFELNISSSDAVCEHLLNQSELSLLQQLLYQHQCVSYFQQNKQGACLKITDQLTAIGDTCVLDHAAILQHRECIDQSGQKQLKLKTQQCLLKPQDKIDFQGVSYRIMGLNVVAEQAQVAHQQKTRVVTQLQLQENYTFTAAPEKKRVHYFSIMQANHQQRFIHDDTHTLMPTRDFLTPYSGEDYGWQFRYEPGSIGLVLSVENNQSVFAGCFATAASPALVNQDNREQSIWQTCHQQRFIIDDSRENNFLQFNTKDNLQCCRLDHSNKTIELTAKRGNTKVTAAKTIQFQSGQSIKMSSGADIEYHIGRRANYQVSQGDISLNTGRNYLARAAKICITSENNSIQLNAGNHFIAHATQPVSLKSASMTLQSSKGSITINSRQQQHWQAKQDKIHLGNNHASIDIKQADCVITCNQLNIKAKSLCGFSKKFILGA